MGTEVAREIQVIHQRNPRWGGDPGSLGSGPGRSQDPELCTRDAESVCAMDKTVSGSPRRPVSQSDGMGSEASWEIIRSG